MALVTHPPDLLESSHYSSLTASRHLPGRADAEYKPPIRHGNFSYSASRLRNFEHRQFWHGLHGGGVLKIQDLTQHHVAALAAEATRFRTRARRNNREVAFSARTLGHHRRAWVVTHEEEGRDLAKCHDLHFPGDGCRRRTPSLERQDAFRDERTTKKRGYLHDSDHLDESGLYRLGLLYDDEHERGAGFNVKAITHDEPSYAIHVRPAKRGWRVKARKFHQTGGLPLHLSFARLGDDEVLAQYLISPDDSENDLEDGSTEAGPDRANRSASYPLPAIQELETSSSADLSSDLGPNPSISQNILALTNTHSLKNQTEAPEVGDFPDLISDSDADADELEGWELVRTTTTPHRNYRTIDRNDHPDASWVVLD